MPLSRFSIDDPSYPVLISAQRNEPDGEMAMTSEKFETIEQLAQRIYDMGALIESDR
jgi:hypothetical protein